MSNITYIHNGNIVLENGILWDGALLIENGKIAKIGKEKDLSTPASAKIIDAKGAYVGPGFVDIHVHGGNGSHSCEDPVGVANYFLAHGETTILPTIEYLFDKEKMLSCIENVKAAMPSAKNIKGIYMEGPFININYGAAADTNPWKGNIPPEDFMPLVDACGDLVKIWSTAAEREDILPFVTYARKVKPDVIFALTHSEATPMQIRAMGKYKPNILTHCCNATGRQPVPNGTRGYGPDEYCFQTPDMYAEMICDSQGIHVHPEIQRLILRCKGIHRVILITDSTYPQSPNPPELAHITDLNFDHHGTLSGSKMTMDQACRNIMTHTNCGIAQAFLMASTNPARAIGMDEEIGSIEVGKNADFVFVDDRFNVQKVILNGEECL